MIGFKSSLRSKRKVDVAEICQQFGGGGHIRAAGYYRKGTIDEITNELLEILSTKDMD